MADGLILRNIGRGSCKAETRQGGNDDVKREYRFRFAGAGVGEQGDQMVKPIERVRPSMQEQDGDALISGAGLMNEVKIVVVDGRGEVVEAVKGALLLSPVVFVAPIGSEFLQVFKVCALIPAGVRCG